MRKSNSPLLVLAGLFLVLLYVWFFFENLSQQEAINRKPLDIGSAAPNFTLYSSTGELIKSSSLFIGNKTILVFFSPYCQRCRDNTPFWFNLFDKYKSQISLNMVGICNCNSGELDDFWVKTETKFRVLIDQDGIDQEYHVTYEPTVFLIDEKGKIAFTSYEYPNKEGLKVVEMILRKS